MLDRQEGNKLFQLLMDFYQKTSIITISNKGVSDWARTLGDNVGTTAIMDRLLHHCEVFNIDGDSWRLENKTNILADLLDPK
jgi:DNA replication protein DnaC